MIPAVAELDGWTRLRPLREFLQTHGRLLEAGFVLDQELGDIADGSEQEKACRSLLEACISLKNSEEPIWWISGRTKLRLGQILTAGNQVQASDDMFQGATRALEAARASGYQNNTLLLVRLAELKALSEFGHQDALQAYDEFVQCASVKKDSYIHSTALTRACTIALVNLESENSPSNLKTFWQWNRKAESILEELGDIAHLSIFRLATGDIACRLEEDFGAILNWHEDFEMNHPSFHLWRHKTAVRKANLFIYKRLNDEYNIHRTNSEMRSVVADQDNFWSDDGFRKQADIKASSKDRKPDMTYPPAVFQNGDPEMDWLFEWSGEITFSIDRWKNTAKQIGPDSASASSILEVYLCSWIKEEFQAGVLTQKDLTDMLSSDSVSDDDLPQVTKGLDHHHIKQDEPKEHARDAIKSEASSLKDYSKSTFEDEMTSLTPETLVRRLFGTYTAPASESRWEKAYSTLSDWLLRRSTRSEARRHFLLVQTQNQRLSCVIHSPTSFELRGLEAQRLLDLFPNLEVKVQEHMSSNLAYWRSTVAAAKHMMYIQSRGNVLLDMHSPETKEIIELYNQSLADNRDKNGPLIRDVYINMDIAHVYFYGAKKMDPTAFEGLSNAVVRAVQAFEKIRAGWRALTGWDRVHKLLLAMEERRILQIVPTFVNVICQVPDDKREARDKLIWGMIQFAKTIGISWLMDSNAADAREKANGGRNDNDHIHVEAVGSQSDPKKASDLKGDFSTQRDTGQNSDEDPTTGKRQANAEANATKADNYVEDQTNASLDTDQLQADLQNINHLGGDAVFVDWYNIACGLAESPRPVITTLSGTNEGPRCSLVSTTWKEVDELVNQFMVLDTDDLEDEECTEFLYGLNPLVEPLAWTKPGQTLVFSPCGNLHRIPLHALKIDGEVIIKRNPVVYCSSMSALVSTYRLRKQMEPHSSIRSTTDVSNNEDPDPSPRVDSNLKVSLFGRPPSRIGQAALKATATKFKARPHTDESFNASSFTSTIQDPNLHLLHYHGHVDFSPTAHTDHCLLFSRTDRLTLRDIFDLPCPLRHGGGFHVTLLGCGSGMSKTGPTDDVVGLVPSLLYAGASSTVSTLWKFSDADAAAYSESFYEGFFGGGTKAGEKIAEEVPSAGDIVVDMAKANQNAILGIMQRKPALYHWASFVLNGYWMMRSPLGN